MFSPIISPKNIYRNCNHVLTVSGTALIQPNHRKKYSDLHPGGKSSQIVRSPVQSKRDNLIIITAGWDSTD